jgi:hypothetical protein
MQPQRRFVLNHKIPRHLKINMPGSLLIEGENAVAVRINESANDIQEYREYYASRLFNFEFEDDLYLQPDIMQQVKGKRIKINPSARVFEIGKDVKLYKNAITVFFANADEDLIKVINYLTAFGFQVHIDTTAALKDSSILEKAVEFYLHNPLLKTPIEPFHTLVKTLGSGGGFTLWDTEYEKLSGDVYLSDLGEVSLSKRWLESGQSYGNLDDSWEKLSNSSLFIALKEFRQELFRRKSPCIFCSHLDICAGYLKAVDGNWHCEPWINAFDILKNEVKRAKALMQNMNGDKK